MEIPNAIMDLIDTARNRREAVVRAQRDLDEAERRKRWSALCEAVGDLPACVRLHCNPSVCGPAGRLPGGFEATTVAFTLSFGVPGLLEMRRAYVYDVLTGLWSGADWQVATKTHWRVLTAQDDLGEMLLENLELMREQSIPF